MSYSKQTFVDNETILQAKHLDHIEDGITDNNNTLTQINTNLSSLSSRITVLENGGSSAIINSFTISVVPSTITLVPDSDGNIDYSSAVTQAYAYYNGENVTSKCTFSTVVSTGITGVSSNNKYTVSSLSGNNGTITFTGKYEDCEYTAICSVVKASSAASAGNGIADTQIRYAIWNTSKNPENIPEANWSNSILEATTQMPYLWTRTKLIYDDGTSSISYTVSYALSASSSYTSVQTIYYYTTSTAIPSAPTSWVETLGPIKNQWCLAQPPEKDDNDTNTYYYWTCAQRKDSSGKAGTTPVVEYVNEDKVVSIVGNTVTADYVNALHISAASIYVGANNTPLDEAVLSLQQNTGSSSTAAGQTASNYIGIKANSTGIKLYPNISGLSKYYRTCIYDTGMDIEAYDANSGTYTTRASFTGTDIALGDTSGKNVLINSGGIHLFASGNTCGTNEIAHFGYATASSDSSADDGYSYSSAPYNTLGLRDGNYGGYSTILGFHNTASGVGSFASGRGCVASGNYAHALGYHTTALGRTQVALGKYNVSNSSDSTYLIIGSGTKGANADIFRFRDNNLDVIPAKGSTSNPSVNFYNRADKYVIQLIGRTVTETISANYTIYLDGKNGKIDISSSDARLKENIKNTEVNALELINKIQFREFDWKLEGRADQLHQKVGIVADELELIEPSLVTGGKNITEEDPDYRSIENLYLTCYEGKAIQELSAQITELQNQIAELKSKLNS